MDQFQEQHSLNTCTKAVQLKTPAAVSETESVISNL